VLPARDGGSDDLWNLQSLCGGCHSLKTFAEGPRGGQISSGKTVGQSPGDTFYTRELTKSANDGNDIYSKLR